MNGMDILLRAYTEPESKLAEAAKEGRKTPHKGHMTKMVAVLKTRANPMIFDPTKKHGVSEMRARKYANREASAQLGGSKDMEAWTALRDQLYQQLVADPSKVASHLSHLNPSLRSEEQMQPEVDPEVGPVVQEEETDFSRQKAAMEEAMERAKNLKEIREAAGSVDPEDLEAPTDEELRQPIPEVPLPRHRPGDELFDEEGRLRQTSALDTKSPRAGPIPPSPPRSRADPSGSEEQARADIEPSPAPMPELEMEEEEETPRPRGQSSLFDFGKGFGEPSLGDTLLKSIIDRMYQGL